MFPGAVADYERAAYAIIGAPLDATTTFRPGTRFGPHQLRHVAQSFEDFDHRTGISFTDCDVYDHGDVRPGDDVGEYLEFLRGAVLEYVEQDTISLLLGGEHTVTIAGLRAIEPTTFVCLDAHLDLRSSYADNPLSHATVSHHALNHAEEVIILGARAGCKAEWDRAAGADVTAVPPADVGEWVPEFDGDAYLSVDIDAADPGFAPGTGTPEPFGLTPSTMHEIVREVAPRAVGFDVVEVNDRDDGQAATLGAKLLRAFVYAHAAANHDGA